MTKKASYTTKFFTIKAEIFQKLDLPKSSCKSIKVEHNVSPVDGEDQVQSAITKTTENFSKRAKLDCNQSFSGKKEWLCRGGIKLMLNDRDSIIRGERLNDMVINIAQKLLKSNFSKLKGFQSTLLQNKKFSSDFELNKVQIIHSRGDQWMLPQL